jgi:hypothetical protein
LRQKTDSTVPQLGPAAGRSSTFEIIEGLPQLFGAFSTRLLLVWAPYSIVRRLNADSVPTFTGKGGWADVDGE